MARERRTHVRQRVDLNATLVVRDSLPETARVRDLGLGGARVELSSSPAYGTHVVLRVELGAQPVSLVGVVRWARPGAVGIQFGPLGALETHCLTEFLATAPPPPDTRPPSDDGALGSGPSGSQRGA